MKIISLILFVFMSLVGIAQTVVYTVLKKRLQGWPTVAAQVTHARLLNQVSPDGKTLMEAVIYFKYSYQGKEYKANTPALRGYELFPSLDYEAKLVEKYNVDEFYNVKVSPRAPELAYLEIAPLSTASTILAPMLSILGITLLYLLVTGQAELYLSSFLERLFQT